MSLILLFDDEAITGTGTVTIGVGAIAGSGTVSAAVPAGGGGYLVPLPTRKPRRKPIPIAAHGAIRIRRPRILGRGEVLPADELWLVGLDEEALVA